MDLECAYLMRKRTSGSSLPQRLASHTELSYGERGAYLVFFCRGTRPSPEGGVHFVSCEGEVLPWLDDDDGYAGAMFRV